MSSTWQFKPDRDDVQVSYQMWLAVSLQAQARVLEEQFLRQSPSQRQAQRQARTRRIMREVCTMGARPARTHRGIVLNR